MGLDLFPMACLVAEKEKSPVDLRVKGFDAAVEHFWKSRVIFNRHRGNPRLLERVQGAACGKNFRAVLSKSPGKRNKTGFIGNADQRAANGVSWHKLGSSF